jgi:ABC-type uncharacterized transport system permease subunit
MLLKIALIAFAKGLIVALYAIILDQLEQRRLRRRQQHQEPGA